MNPKHPRAEEVFGAALDLADPQGRAEYLARVCAGDEVLRQQVQTLLAAHAQARTFLERPPSGLAERAGGTVVVGAEPGLPPPVGEAPGDRIGPYKLLEMIGEGGFGVVWVAEQSSPVHRRVALKVLKPGMDTREVVARFEAERQALALMDHPGIAQVFDGGATASGRPYVVMELVRGVAITRYCDDHRLTTDERLRLFCEVCRAVQHAHQKGIIHRDLKPSNILVTELDGQPQPKIVDFGVAKAREQPLTGKTLFTRAGQMLGTPAYMSPEQTGLGGLDVDTRSDVYALGVILYELLTGRTPFEAQPHPETGYATILDTIRHVDPPKPSARLQRLSPAEVTTLAGCHREEPRRLGRLLRGEMDWIVMKCLEKDRARRYATAYGLALDLERHLNHEPILARPPTALYRLRKLVRRNRLLFAAAGAVGLALVIGAGVSLWQASQAQVARRLAENARGDAEQLLTFLLADFYDELQPLGRLDTVGKLAERMVQYYDGLPASLRAPETQRNRALALARLGLVRALQGDAGAAQPIAAATNLFRARRAQGDASRETTVGLGVSLYAQSVLEEVQGDFVGEAAALREATALLRPEAFAPESPPRIRLEYANILNDFAFFQPPDEGIARCREALGLLEALGARSLAEVAPAAAYGDLTDTEARLALNLGQFEAAQQLERDAQTLADRILVQRPGHLRALRVRFWAPQVLSMVAAKRFDYAAALAYATNAEQAARTYLRYNPADVPWGGMALVGTRAQVADLRFEQGEVSQAVEAARAGAAEYDAPGAPGVPLQVLFLWSRIAQWETQRGRRMAGERALDRARTTLAVVAARNRMPASAKALWVERLEDTQRSLQLSLGAGESQDAALYLAATNALRRLRQLPTEQGKDQYWKPYKEDLVRDARHQAVVAALRGERFREAEAQARALLDEPPAIVGDPDEPANRAWAGVLLAEAVVRQPGRQPAAQAALGPALAYYRDAQGQGARHLEFRQRFARALFVAALAEPSGPGSTARAVTWLERAAALLDGLPEEARQLQDSRALRTAITLRRRRLDTSPAISP